MASQTARSEKVLELGTDTGITEAEQSNASSQENPDTPENEHAASGEEEWKYVTGLRLFTVTAAVTLTTFIMLLDTSIIVTAIPRITSDFHSLDDVGWYGSAYLLASCALQPMTGKLYNQFNARKTYLFFIGLFELGSLICGVARSSDMLIIGRAIAGLGGAGLINGSLTILTNCVPLHKRATYFGIMFSVAQIGIVFGPVLGGLLTQHVSWRWCFYINLPVGAIVAILLVVISIPDRSKKTAVKGTWKSILDSLDIPGFFLFAPTSVMFLLALQWGGVQHRWGSATIIGLFCGAFFNLLIFLAWEHRRGDSAMVPFSIIRERVVWTSCLFIMFFFGALLIIAYYLSIYFQAVRGYSPTLSGVYVLPSILPQMVFALVSGILIGKTGYYLPWAIGCGVFISIGAGLLSTLTPTSSTAMWAGYQVILGVGRGGGFQTPILAVQNHLPESTSAIGSAILVFFQTFGGAVFLSFAQTGFAVGLGDNLPKYAPGISPQIVIAAGASTFRDVVGEANVAGVILAYNAALVRVFYLAVGISVGAFLASWGMGWKSVKKVKPKEATRAEEEGETTDSAVVKKDG